MEKCSKTIKPMSSSYIDAKIPRTESPTEREIPSLNLYFGLFFCEKGNTSIGSELSKLYKKGVRTKPDEKYYSIIASYSNYADGLENVLSHMLWIIEGYSQHKKNVNIFFDVFGIDKGFIEGFLFCNLFDSSVVSNLSNYISIYNSIIKQQSKEIVEFSKSTLLHSFTFVSPSEPPNADIEESDTISDNQKAEPVVGSPIDNYITGGVTYNEYLDASISSDGPVLETYRGNFFTELYSKYIIFNLNARDWIDEKLKIMDNAGLVLLLVPEPTQITKVLSIGIEILSVMGNLACASISFGLGVLMFRGERTREEEFRKGHEYLLNAVPFSDKTEVVCKVFGKGFKFMLQNNNLKLEDLKRARKEAQKLVRGKKMKEAEGRFYHQETRKIRQQNRKLEELESVISDIEKDDTLMNNIEFLNNLIINIDDEK